MIILVVCILRQPFSILSSVVNNVFIRFVKVSKFLKEFEQLDSPLELSDTTFKTFDPGSVLTNIPERHMKYSSVTVSG